MFHAPCTALRMEFVADAGARAKRTLSIYWTLFGYFILVGVLADVYAAVWVALYVFVAPMWVVYFAGGIANMLGVMGIVTGIFVGIFFSSVPASVNSSFYQMQALHGELLEFLRCTFDCSSIYDTIGKDGMKRSKEAREYDAELRITLAQRTKALVLASHALLGGDQVYMNQNGSNRPMVPDPWNINTDGVLTLGVACRTLCNPKHDDNTDAHQILSENYHDIIETLVRLFLVQGRDDNAIFNLLHAQLDTVRRVLLGAYTAPAVRPDVFNWFVVGTIYMYILVSPLMLIRLTWFSLFVYPVIVWVYAGPVVVRNWIFRRQKSKDPYYDVRAWTRITLARLERVCKLEMVDTECHDAPPTTAVSQGMAARSRHAYVALPGQAYGV